MQIGAYSFVNPKTFRGMEGYGFECDIKKGKRTFAYYHEDGNGGMGDLRVEYDENPARFEENRTITALFEQFALSICPPFPASPEYGIPEHPGDLDYFFAHLSTWIDLEKQAKAIIRKNRGARQISITFDRNGDPSYLFSHMASDPEAAMKSLKDRKEKERDEDKMAKAVIIPVSQGFIFDRFPEAKTI